MTAAVVSTTTHSSPDNDTSNMHAAPPNPKDPTAIRAWLSQHMPPKPLALLDAFLVQVRLGRLGQRPKKGSAAAWDDDDDDNDEEDDSPTTTTQPKVDRRRAVWQTVELLKHVVGETQWKTAAELLDLIKALGWELEYAQGSKDPALFNVIRRVLAAIREEASHVATSTTTTSSTDMTSNKNRLSLDSILWALPQHVRDPKGSSGGGGARGSTRSQSQQETSQSSSAQDYPASFYSTPQGPELKQAVLEALQEVQSDVEDLYSQLEEHAATHIAAGDVILTCGSTSSSSQTLERFLKAALKAHRRNKAASAGSGSTFQVLVAQDEDDSDDDTTSTARRLANAGIDTCIVSHAAVFGVMARVNKCLLPEAHAVLANGGLVAPSGCRTMALCAQHFAVPVVCVTGSFTLCPTFPHQGQDTYNEWTSPSSSSATSSTSALTYQDAMSPAFSQGVEWVCPVRDYVAPELVQLYVTNVGSFQPSFIYRLLAEYYHSDDWDLY